MGTTHTLPNSLMSFPETRDLLQNFLHFLRYEAINNNVFCNNEIRF